MVLRPTRDSMLFQSVVGAELPCCESTLGC